MPEVGRVDAATPEPWRAFLKALDERLSERVELHCIGGFVVTLLYGLSRETSDMDVLTAVPHDRLTQLQTLAGQGSALHRRFKVYLQPVRIATYPEDYAARLIPMCGELADRQDVQSLAAAGFIDEATLRERYATEYRPNLAAGAEKQDLTMQLWVEMCWPRNK